MHKIITFLGTDSQTTLYQFSDKPISGKVFAYALYQYLKFDRMLVFVTPEAKRITWPILQNLNDKQRILPVDIPNGVNDAEIWQIFTKMQQQLQPGDEVTFDITHGLRSIPFLVFLFAAYLKAAGHVKIRAIYYGAKDLSDSASAVRTAPVLDLSGFIDMLDWIAAAGQFTQSGNATALATLLTQSSPGSALADLFKQVSETALACQPVTLIQSASEMNQALAAAKGLPAPFLFLKDSIQETFQPFAADPVSDPRGFVAAEYRLMGWYWKNRQIMPAATLAGEWLIDGVILLMENRVELNYAERHHWQSKLNQIKQLGDPMKKQPGTFYGLGEMNPEARSIYTRLAGQAEVFRTTYKDASELRNLFAHVEHRDPAELISIEAAFTRFEEIMVRIDLLAQAWKLIPEGNRP